MTIKHKLFSALAFFLTAFLFIGCGGSKYKVIVTATGFDLTYSDKVVLQINEQGNLEITRNGTHEFTLTLKDGDDYTLTITSSPLLQNCSITGGAGTVDKADVAVTLACTDKSWTHPADFNNSISFADYKTYLAPVIAMNDSGDAIVVWGQDNGLHTMVYKSEYRNGVWTHPSDVAADSLSPSGEMVHELDAAIDNDGNAIIVWTQDDGTNNAIFMSEFRNGSWEHPVDLSDNISPDLYVAGGPSIAMDNNGDAIVVWWQYETAGPPNPQIYKREYRNGSWSAEPDLTNDKLSSDPTASGPMVAMSDSGDAIIVWREDTSVHSVFKKHYKANQFGTWMWGSAEYISDQTEDAWGPYVAMNASGEAIIGWGQYNPTNQMIYKRQYLNGEWTAMPSLSTDNVSPTGQQARNARISMDSSGKTILAWAQNDGSYDMVYKSEYATTEETSQFIWTNPSGLDDHISPDGGGACGCGNYIALEMDNYGNAIMAWQQNNATDGSGDNAVYMAEYRKGSWSAPSGLDQQISFTGTGAEVPAVGMDQMGNAILAWRQYPEGSSNAQIYVIEFK